MSMTVGGSGGGRNAEMNVTPLIDVMLVLLIIFMVITPLKNTGLEALVPQPDKRTETKPAIGPDTTVVLQILNADIGGRPALKINHEDVSWENLQGRLRDIFAIRVQKVLFVKGDEELAFSEIANAIDIAHNAGIDKVGLVTNTLQAGN